MQGVLDGIKGLLGGDRANDGPETDRVEVIDAESLEVAGFALGDPLAGDEQVRRLEPLLRPLEVPLFAKVFDFTADTREEEALADEVLSELSVAVAAGEQVLYVIRTPGLHYIVMKDIALGENMPSVPPPAAKWFYINEEGASTGPVSMATLRGMEAYGELRPESLVWAFPMESWKPLSEQVDLLSQIENNPTSAPAPVGQQQQLHDKTIQGQRISDAEILNNLKRHEEDFAREIRDAQRNAQQKSRLMEGIDQASALHAKHRGPRVGCDCLCGFAGTARGKAALPPVQVRAATLWANADSKSREIDPFRHLGDNERDFEIQTSSIQEYTPGAIPITEVYVSAHGERQIVRRLYSTPTLLAKVTS
ncbi:hypothetical protein AB1Y20_009438 [Prymnesium parvum]|uniref:GYF domain-containing protein n=1 Tax=Prymnesium parvum TaxID=97485 RepID=A0AB34K4H9_PRYPA